MNMARKYTQISFTDSVKQAQVDFAGRDAFHEVDDWEGDDEHLSKTEKAFISERDSFYMASVNRDGWPYVQFRGGLPGFLKVIDDQTLGYADFSGNRSYVSTGNLRENDRASLFFMDYAKKRRLKIMVRTEIFKAEENPELLGQVEDVGYRGRIERVVRFRVVAFEWSCPQHITPRFTEAEWSQRGEQGE